MTRPFFIIGLCLLAAFTMYAAYRKLTIHHCLDERTEVGDLCFL